MPLTARDPDTGRIIWPFASGKHEATCRDPLCAAKVTAIRQVGEGDDVARRPHWRHSVRNDGCLTKRDNDQKTIWHVDWQRERSDPSQVEVRGTNGDNPRIADIMTDYGFIIEVQHSAIRAKTMHARENYWHGKVIWLFDGTEGNTGGVDFYRGMWRWSAPMTAALDAKTLVAVDAGDTVYLLNPDGKGVTTSGGDILHDPDTIRSWTRAEFVDLWVNSARMPIGSFTTRWTREARKRAAGRKPKSVKVTVDDLAKADAKWDVCGYNGDRDKLIMADVQEQYQPTVTPVTGSPVHGCGGASCRTLGCANRAECA